MMNYNDKDHQLMALPSMVAFLAAEMCSNIGIGNAGSAMRPIAEGECRRIKIN
jgi:hypothetical protein